MKCDQKHILLLRGKQKKHFSPPIKVLVRNWWNVSELTMIAIISLRVILMCPLYTEDCEFADPFTSFRGRQRFVQNLKIFGWTIRSEKKSCAGLLFSPMSRCFLNVFFSEAILNVVASRAIHGISVSWSGQASVVMVMSGDVIPNS